MKSSASSLEVCSEVLRELPSYASRLLLGACFCLLLSGPVISQDGKQSAGGAGKRSAERASVAGDERELGKRSGSLGQSQDESAKGRELLKSVDARRQADLPQALARKEALLEFAGSQDKQLGQLLRKLEQQRPQQFREALLNLARDEERLTNLQSRDRERYELELQQWKNNQRLQIVAARLALSGDAEGGREQLEKLLQSRQELRRQILELEVRRAEERVTRAQEQLSRFEQTKTADLKRQADLLLARIKRGASRSVAGAPNPPAGNESVAKKEAANKETDAKAAEEKAVRNQKDK